MDVNSSSIDQAAYCVLLLPYEAGRELHEIVVGADSGNFDDRGVRFKMVGPFGETIFINQQGDARARRDGALTQDSLKRITAIFERNCPRFP